MIDLVFALHVNSATAFKVAFVCAVAVGRWRLTARIRPPLVDANRRKESLGARRVEIAPLIRLRLNGERQPRNTKPAL